MCRAMLALDKHLPIEGFVFECNFDQCQMSLPEAAARSMQPTDVELAVFRSPKSSFGLGGDLDALVLARRRSADFGRHCIAPLSTQIPVWHVESSRPESQFLAEGVVGNLRQPSIA